MKLFSKNKIAIFLIFVCVALAAACGFLCLAPSAQTQSDFYWSKTNAPVIYGASQITLPLSEADTFDIKDARFRTFARDFEDGDIEIKCEQNSVKGEAGSYEIKYSATDSHGNSTSLTVPVTVSDVDKICVRRRIYCTPSDWNMTQAGFTRGNNDDRQIVGIYLPVNASFEMKLISGAPNITVAMLNNDQNKETAQTINSTEFTSVTNNYTQDFPADEKYPGNYANVPLISTPKLGRGVDISTVYEVEVRYSPSEVHTLNYYHYLDKDEETFKTTWRESGDGFAVLDSSIMTILLPIGDIEAYATLGKNGLRADGFVFDGYNDHFDYYQKVVQKMDEIIGLSFTPEKATDQNIRAKYLVKANAHGAGGAYYAGNHVGINNPSMGSFYQMNWGGLHEFAHGYQGWLGSGSMGLGETSNNILAHYIQIDKSIYSISGDWLGTLSDIEEGINKLRKDGKVFNDFGETPKNKLYILINLFDHFEGYETYAKLFSYFRQKVDEGVFKQATPQEDVYALFFAEVYETNIVPYWSQWGLNVSEEVQEKVFELSKTSLSVLDESAGGGEATNALLAQQEDKLKYGLITDEQLAKANIKGKLTVNIRSDDGSIPSGKVCLHRGDKIVYSASISDGKAVFASIEAGCYMLRPPADFDYDYSSALVMVEAGENEYTVNYKKTDRSDYHSTTLKILGIYGTDGFVLKLRDHNKAADLTFGAANIGCATGAWASRTDEVYASVEIKDGSGTSKYLWQVYGGGYFCYLENKVDSISLDYGYTITVKTYLAGNVKVLSNIDGKVIEAYNYNGSGLQEMTYKVTEYGLEAQYGEKFAPADVLYEHVADELKASLKESAKYFEDNPESLQAKYLDKNKKEEFLQNYAKLKDADREEFSALFKSIQKGGTPQVKAINPEIEVQSVDDINWSECFSAYDNEDGEIVYGENVKVVETSVKSVYEIRVTDSDGNVGSCFVTVRIKTPISGGEDDKTGDSGNTGSIDDNHTSIDKTDDGNDEILGVIIIAAIVVVVFALFLTIIIVVVRRRRRE